MPNSKSLLSGLLIAGGFLLWSQERPVAPRDAVQEAQGSMTPAPKRPEQAKTPHDQSDRFSAAKAEPTSPAFKTQPKEGQDHRLRLLPRPAQRRQARSDLRGGHEEGHRRQARR